MKRMTFAKVLRECNMSDCSRSAQRSHLGAHSQRLNERLALVPKEDRCPVLSIDDWQYEALCAFVAQLLTFSSSL